MKKIIASILAVWCIGVGTAYAQKWDYLSGRGYVICDAILKRLNSYQWTREQTFVHGIAVAESYQGWKEPPWQDLDPQQHKGLILELIKYRNLGADVYFGRKPRQQGNAEDDQKRAELELQDMSQKGLQFRIWRTHLINWFGDDPAPPSEQTVVQLRSPWEKQEWAKRGKIHPGKPLIQWWTANFIVTDDLKGPNSRVREWIARTINRVLLFHGIPHFIGGSGQTVEISRSFGSGPPSQFCELEFDFKHGRK